MPRSIEVAAVVRGLVKWMEDDGDGGKSQKSKRGIWDRFVGAFWPFARVSAVLLFQFFKEQLVAIENQNTTSKAGRQARWREAADMRGAHSLNIQTMDEADIKRINSIAAFLSRQISSSFSPTHPRHAIPPARSPDAARLIGGQWKIPGCLIHAHCVVHQSGP